jgi:hypothetical protein
MRRRLARRSIAVGPEVTVCLPFVADALAQKHALCHGEVVDNFAKTGQPLDRTEQRIANYISNVEPVEFRTELVRTHPSAHVGKVFAHTDTVEWVTFPRRSPYRSGILFSG